MRMRTIPETARIIKEDDPRTAITPATLRRMIKNGLIPVTQVGNRQFIDVDKLGDYLSGKLLERHDQQARPVGIRPIQE